MSDKFLYQNGRIKAMESGLLGYQQLQRLLDADDLKDVFRILVELGYGQGVAIENGDFDLLIETEERNAVGILKTFNVDGALDAFLLENDYQNLKALAKAKVNADKRVVLVEDGVVDVDSIKRALDGDFEALNPSFVQSVIKVNNYLEGNVSSRGLDVLVDKEMFANISQTAKKGGKLVVKHFERKADYANVSAFIRSRNLAQPLQFFLDGFVSGGRLGVAVFESVYDEPIEQFVARLKETPYEQEGARLAESNDFVAYEVAVDNLTLKEWKNNFNEIFTPAPIIYYYLSRLTEIKIIKLLVAGIKNRVEPSLIKKRMRDIYGS